MTQQQPMAGGANGFVPTQSFKSVSLVKRRADMTHEQYREHQLGTHVPLAHKLPGLISYEYFDFPPSAEGEDQPYDGMAVLEWESLAAFQNALASEHGAAALADLPNFVDPEEMLTLTGPTMLWRDGLGS
jgi:uncharacterized protein (TIGR02118 family)